MENPNHSLPSLPLPISFRRPKPSTVILIVDYVKDKVKKLKRNEPVDAVFPALIAGVGTLVVWRMINHVPPANPSEEAANPSEEAEENVGADRGAELLSYVVAGVVGAAVFNLYNRKQ